MPFFKVQGLLQSSHRRMLDGKCHHHHLFLADILRQCKTITQLHQIHAFTLTNSFLSPHFLTKILYTLTTLIPAGTTQIPSSAALSHYAISTFNSISTPSTFSYNTIIRSLSLLHFPTLALRFFIQMRRFSIPPDFHSFPFALKACGLFGAHSVTQSLHSQAYKFGFLSDLYVTNSLIRIYSMSASISDAYRMFEESPQRDLVTYNSMIDGLVKAGDVDKARALFDAMPAHDAVSFGTIIAGYSHQNCCEEAIEVFEIMMKGKVRPDNFGLVSTLSACAQLGELEKGQRIHDYIENNKIRVDSFLATGLVDLYAKCGCIDIALKVFESCHDKGLITWNAMLVGLAMHGHGELLLNYFSRMIKARVKPDGVSILGVLVGCSHGGLVDEARRIFHEMESVYEVPRELKHYGCMADLLGRAGLIGEATEMIQRMPMSGDASVWSGLLGGCRIHGDIEAAEEAAKHVMELKPEDGGVYSILASVYANAERWEDVVNVRRSLSNNRVVKKNVGCSSIRVDGIAHDFFAGDILHHPHSDDIYLVLTGMREHECEFRWRCA